MPSVIEGSTRLPVRGPVHTDDGNPQAHRHYDMRFITRRMECRLGWPLPHRCRGDAPATVARGHHARTGWPFQCARSDTFGGCVFSGAPRDMAAVEVNGRWLCPHRGADLTSVPQDANGDVRCPLHGARVRIPGYPHSISLVAGQI